MVTAPLAGALARPELRPGDAVALDGVIARVSPLPSPLLDARSRSELEGRLAIASVQQRQAQALVSRARVAADFAKQDLARGSTLAGSSAIPGDELDRRRLAAELATREVRSAQLQAQVADKAAETAQVMIGDWLRTGDIGRMDHGGFVFIEDRKKDMILVSGFNVYPNEIESVVAAHPGVLEVAAVAQDDERSGEAVALFVVKKDPNLTEQQLVDYCRGELTGYKVPKHVYFRTELPKTNVGKILRRELRDSLKNPASG